MAVRIIADAVERDEELIEGALRRMDYAWREVARRLVDEHGLEVDLEQLWLEEIHRKVGDLPLAEADDPTWPMHVQAALGALEANALRVRRRDLQEAVETVVEYLRHCVRECVRLYGAGAPDPDGVRDAATALMELVVENETDSFGGWVGWFKADLDCSNCYLREVLALRAALGLGPPEELLELLATYEWLTADALDS